ncbi:MAG: DUF2304 domain-containing protein [Armatimonadota bacterium]
MNVRVQIIAVVFTILAAMGLLELVRKHKLKEEYSIVWIGAVVILGIFSFHRPWVEGFAEMVGIAYAPSAVFVLAIGLISILLLQVTLTISRLLEMEKKLTQEVALLKAELEKVKNDKE